MIGQMFLSISQLSGTEGVVSLVRMLLAAMDASKRLSIQAIVDGLFPLTMRYT